LAQKEFWTIGTVVVIVAHDDDPLLTSGAFIRRCLEAGWRVSVVICTDGRTSHKAVFGVDNPPMEEVARRRKEEARRAYDILGVKELHYLDLPKEEGRVWQNREEAKRQLQKIIEEEKPNTILTHFPDAHPDHRAVAEVVSEIVGKETEILRFSVWRKELSQGRREISSEFEIELPSPKLTIYSTPEEKEKKKQALFEMKSQVMNWPYPHWPVQKRPILEKNFVDFFLENPEEFF
jgi:LmbE family N-acetylglucosaminyl deacetylase